MDRCDATRTYNGWRPISDLRGNPEGQAERGAQPAHEAAHTLRLAEIASQFAAFKQGVVTLQRRRIDHWFPPRQILVRGPGKVAAINVGQRLQIWFVSVCLIGFFGFFFAMISAGMERYHAASMAREVAKLRNSAQLEARRATEERAWLATLSDELKKRVAERDRAAAAGESLAERQKEIDQLLNQRESAIDQALEERGRIAAERDQALAERDAAIAANRDTLSALDNQTKATIAQVERIIRSTGLDPARLAPLKPPVREDRNAPRGGPFIPFSAARPDPLGPVPPEAVMVPGFERLRSLVEALRHVPLASPVPRVEISSPFGYRLDPITHAASLHEGVDLRGPRGTPIFATAPGTVVFAGRLNEYGYAVEIDHGYGLLTRYGHLDRVLVKPGSQVGLRTVIGTMGATGRATGVHLHYETRIDGRATDPLHFLKADHHVLQEDAAPVGNASLKPDSD